MALAAICRVANLSLKKSSATWSSYHWLKTKCKQQWLELECRHSATCSSPCIVGHSRIYNTVTRKCTCVFNQTSSYFDVAIGGKRLHTTVNSQIIELDQDKQQLEFIRHLFININNAQLLRQFKKVTKSILETNFEANPPYIIFSAEDADNLENAVYMMKGMIQDIVSNMKSEIIEFKQDKKLVEFIRHQLLKNYGQIVLQCEDLTNSMIEIKFEANPPHLCLTAEDADTLENAVFKMKEMIQDIVSKTSTESEIIELNQENQQVEFIRHQLLKKHGQIVHQFEEGTNSILKINFEVNPPLLCLMAGDADTLENAVFKMKEMIQVFVSNMKSEIIEFKQDKRQVEFICHQFLEKNGQKLHQFQKGTNSMSTINAKANPPNVCLTAEDAVTLENAVLQLKEMIKEIVSNMKSEIIEFKQDKQQVQFIRHQFLKRNGQMVYHFENETDSILEINFEANPFHMCLTAKHADTLENAVFMMKQMIHGMVSNMKSEVIEFKQDKLQVKVICHQFLEKNGQKIHQFQKGTNSMSKINFEVNPPHLCLTAGDADTLENAVYMMKGMIQDIVSNMKSEIIEFKQDKKLVQFIRHQFLKGNRQMVYQFENGTDSILEINFEASPPHICLAAKDADTLENAVFMMKEMIHGMVSNMKSEIIELKQDKHQVQLICRQFLKGNRQMVYQFQDQTNSFLKMNFKASPPHMCLAAKDADTLKNAVFKMKQMIQRMI